MVDWGRIGEQTYASSQNHTNLTLCTLRKMINNSISPPINYKRLLDSIYLFDTF